MITAALRSASVCVRTRWIPATPTSVSRSTRLPSARAVTAASSATGRSLVPAVTIKTVPRPVAAGSGSGGRYTVRPSSFTSARGKRVASAARCAGSLRVARKQPLGDGNDLRRRLPLTQDHLLMPLGDGPEVIDGSEGEALDEAAEIV